MENILLYVSLVIAVVTLGFSIFLYAKLQGSIKENKGLSDEINKAGVEGMLKESLVKINKNEQDVKELFEISENIGKLLSKSITKVGFTRYNPFGDTGGDQSFSVALLDSQDSGVIISSLHGRAGTRIYSKPLKGGESEYNITDEERKAIESARGIKKSESDNL